MIPEPQRYILAAKLRYYLDHYEEAIQTLSEGIERDPDSPHLFRHRAHFKVSIREFDDAIQDFERAVELMSDMDDEIEYYQTKEVEEMERILLGEEPELFTSPTPVNESTLAELQDTNKATLKFSVWYHFALAHYLRGDFEIAADHYRSALEHAVDDDGRVAALDWLYMSLQRAGREAEAENVLSEIDIGGLEVDEPSYYRRLKLYKGQLDPHDLLSPPTADDDHSIATQGYGVGNWYLYNGNRDDAIDVFERVLDAGQNYTFGHIAAETELERLEES